MLKMRSDGPDWTAVRASSSWNGLDDQVQGTLRMHGEVPIGFGNIFESSQAAYVRDVQIAQTGQVLRLVSDISPAAVSSWVKSRTKCRRVSISQCPRNSCSRDCESIAIILGRMAERSNVRGSRCRINSKILKSS